MKDKENQENRKVREHDAAMKALEEQNKKELAILDAQNKLAIQGELTRRQIESDRFKMALQVMAENHLERLETMKIEWEDKKALHESAMTEKQMLQEEKKGENELAKIKEQGAIEVKKQEQKNSHIQKMLELETDKKSKESDHQLKLRGLETNAEQEKTKLEHALKMRMEENALAIEQARSKKEEEVEKFRIAKETESKSYIAKLESEAQKAKLDAKAAEREDQKKQILAQNAAMIEGMNKIASSTDEQAAKAMADKKEVEKKKKKSGGASKASKSSSGSAASKQAKLLEAMSEKYGPMYQSDPEKKEGKIFLQSVLSKNDPRVVKDMEAFLDALHQISSTGSAGNLKVAKHPDCPTKVCIAWAVLNSLSDYEPNSTCDCGKSYSIEYNESGDKTKSVVAVIPKIETA